MNGTHISPVMPSNLQHPDLVDTETSTGNPNKIRMRCENPWFQHVSTFNRIFSKIFSQSIDFWCLVPGCFQGVSGGRRAVPRSSLSSASAAWRASCRGTSWASSLSGRSWLATCGSQKITGHPPFSEMFSEGVFFGIGICKKKGWRSDFPNSDIFGSVFSRSSPWLSWF